MDLGRAIAKFAKNAIYGWNESRQCFEPTGKKGSLQVYDRFISDRTFGTKKRILLLPRQDMIPGQYEYVRVGNSHARFLVDALNEDVYSDTPYANCYLVREAKFTVEIGVMQGQTRASGSGGKGEFVVEATVFGDYERYKSDNSSEFHTVDYTVSDIYLPLSAPVTSGKLLRVDGKLYDVTEVARVSNLLWVRGQKMEEDTPPDTLLLTQYACDRTCDFTKVDATILGYQQTVSVTFTHPCQSRLIQVDYDLVGTPVAVIEPIGTLVNIGVYNSGMELLYTFTPDDYTTDGYARLPPPAQGWYLAVTPINPQLLGAVSVGVYA